MISFLEANGYDVSYLSGTDVDSSGSLLLNHKMFVSSGHDEYWSGNQRANVEYARDHGVNLAFFSGNEVFWKTRWEPDSAGNPNRVLVTYKDTHFDAPTDPVDVDRHVARSRGSAPGQPENALTGQYFTVNSGTTDIKVPSQYAALRLWRNTAVASLGAGQSLTLGAGHGHARLRVGRRTRQRVPARRPVRPVVDDVDDRRDLHRLRLDRRGQPDRDPPPLALPRPERRARLRRRHRAVGLGPRRQQPERRRRRPQHAAGHGQPARRHGRAAGHADRRPDRRPTASTNRTPPTSTITSPAAGASVADGTRVTVSGTATASGGSVVAGVEVSTDSGTTWHPATIANAAASTTWTYTWIAHGNPSTTVRSRAVDDNGNLETPSAGSLVNVSCPCSVWGPNVTPGDRRRERHQRDRARREVHGPTSPDRSPASASTRRPPTPAPTSATCGPRPARCSARATFTSETASRLATGQLRHPGADHGEHHLHRVLLRARGPLLGRQHLPLRPTRARVGAAQHHRLRAAARERARPPRAATASTRTATRAAFPTSTYNGENYWVDVSFVPAAPPTAPAQVTGVTATARERVGHRVVVRAVERREPDHVLHGHPVHRRGRPDADDDHRQPAGDRRPPSPASRTAPPTRSRSRRRTSSAPARPRPRPLR